MKRTIVILFAVLLISCSMMRDVVDSSNEIHLKGVSTLPPQNGHWYLFSMTDKQKTLKKIGKGKDETHIARLSIYPLPHLLTDEIFLKHISEMRASKSDTTRLETLRNDEYLSVFQGALCVEYYSTSKGKPLNMSVSETVLNIYGFHCKHPQDPKMGINIEYSLRHRPDTFYPSFDSDAENFFGNVRFTNF